MAINDRFQGLLVLNIPARTSPWARMRPTTNTRSQNVCATRNRRTEFDKDAITALVKSLATVYTNLGI